MAVLIDATQPRTFSGQTAKEILKGFINIRTSGAGELARELELIAIRANQDPGKLRERAAKKAAKILEKGYKDRVRNVTGNLGKSIFSKTVQYKGVTVVVTGPSHRVQGEEWDVNDTQGAGNHGWLVEFGTGARKPGSQNRRAYINVHQRINGRMTRMGSFNNEEFERMGRGYYFLMGSKNEPTRKAKAGSGYPHDFGSDGGRMHPVTMHPGETYGAMTAKHPMEWTITTRSGAVLESLISSLRNYVDELSK
jgi:hypothetical protein